MSTNIFFGASSDCPESQPIRRPAEFQPTVWVKAASVIRKGADWAHFANHMATWATAGRLPLSQ